MSFYRSVKVALNILKTCLKDCPFQGICLFLNYSISILSVQPIIVPKAYSFSLHTLVDPVEHFL